MSNGEDFPQQPAPVLIGPNRELFCCKLPATKSKTGPRDRFFLLTAVTGVRRQAQPCWLAGAAFASMPALSAMATE